jgi:hypothetical protein
MAGKTFDIQVQDDHLERIAQTRKPVLALAELVWNAVDADAKRIDVTLDDNGLGGLKTIRINDDGHGIPYAKAEELFSRLGGSWKQGRTHSYEENRILHGKEGRGRFRAFALGRVVDWDVCAPDQDGTLKCYRISMVKDHLRRVEISDEASADDGMTRGVTVTVSEPERDFRSLRDGSTAEDLSQIFALYLRQYPKVQIFYDGTAIDPRSVEELTTTYVLPDIEIADGEKHSASLEIVEWRIKAQRRLFFCDTNGFPLDETTPGIQAPGFEFTAYLKSDYFANLLASNTLDLANMDPAVESCLTAAKEVMRDHFRNRAAEKAAGLVQEWRNEKIYPYEGEPASFVEKAEREVFNVLALNVNTYLPEFATADEKSKRFQFRLLRQAVEHAPADLARILNEVLDLPQDKRQELAELLDRTTLSAIISASRLVADRLEFLRGIETLIFDSAYRDKVRERTQLHRILAENAWMFGEQYHLSVDDQSLTEVLKKHIAAKGREIEIDEPVKRADGSRGIVDLMFSRNIQLTGAEDREHLVVELKRPKVRIDAEVAAQIESYAFAVADDERFRAVPAKWVFWAVSNDMDDVMARKVSQKDRARGILFQDEEQRVTIWVKTWSQILNDCKARLRFFEDKLNYTPDRDSSLAHLNDTYQKYLSDLFSARAEKHPPPDPANF